MYLLHQAKRTDVRWGGASVLGFIPAYARGVLFWSLFCMGGPLILSSPWSGPCITISPQRNFHEIKPKIIYSYGRQ